MPSETISGFLGQYNYITFNTYFLLGILIYTYTLSKDSKVLLTSVHCEKTM